MGSKRPSLLPSTCTACGLACDDLAVAARPGRVLAVNHACAMGRAWLLRLREASRPAVVAGQPASLADAVGHAAELLAASRLPLFFGFAHASVDTARAAIALAEQCGGLLDPGASHATRALQQAGMPTCSLGEIRQRADVLVFVHCDPSATHPRFFERLVEPPGRFVPAGRRGRFLIQVTGGSPAAWADLFLPVKEAHTLAALWRLRLVLAGRLNDHTWQPLATRLKQARYAVWLFDERLDEPCCRALFQLTAELHAVTRAAAVCLHGGVSPLAEVLCWQTGHATAVSFAGGAPRAGAGAERVLRRGGCDLVVLAGSEPPLSPAARSRLEALPLIRLAHDADGLAAPCRVGIRVAEPGYDAAGVVRRTDGLLLPAPAVLQSSWPTMGDVLRALLAKFS